MACDKELAPSFKYWPPADLVASVQSERGIKQANDMAAKHAYMVETIRAVYFQTLDLFCQQGPADNGGWWQINLRDDKPPSHQGAFAGRMAILRCYKQNIHLTHDFLFQKG